MLSYTFTGHKLHCCNNTQNLIKSKEAPYRKCNLVVFSAPQLTTFVNVISVQSSTHSSNIEFPEICHCITSKRQDFLQYMKLLSGLFISISEILISPNMYYIDIP